MLKHFTTVSYDRRVMSKCRRVNVAGKLATAVNYCCNLLTTKHEAATPQHLLHSIQLNNTQQNKEKNRHLV
jgi:hypothetical protein